MPEHETELEMASRHVAEGRIAVERQRKILAELRRDGHPIEEAMKVLSVFERTQALHEAHLDRLTTK